jgi:hypothetical protein
LREKSSIEPQHTNTTGALLTTACPPAALPRLLFSLVLNDNEPPWLTVSHDGARLPASNTFSIFSFSTGNGFHFLILVRFRIAPDTSIFVPPFGCLLLANPDFVLSVMETFHVMPETASFLEMGFSLLQNAIYWT